MGTVLARNEQGRSPYIWERITQLPQNLGQIRLRSLLASLGPVSFLLGYLYISKRVLWNEPVNGYEKIQVICLKLTVFLSKILKNL